MHPLLTVLLWKSNLNQLLIYSMKVKLYTWFWISKVKCTQYGIFVDKWPSRVQGQVQGLTSPNNSFLLLSNKSWKCPKHWHYADRPGLVRDPYSFSERGPLFMTYNKLSFVLLEQMGHFTFVMKIWLFISTKNFSRVPAHYSRGIITKQHLIEDTS